MKNIWDMYFQYLRNLLEYREDVMFDIMFEAGNSQ